MHSHRILSTLMTWLVGSVVDKFASATELTFNVDAKSVECFYEIIDSIHGVSFEYQVLSGGHYDIDVKVRAMEGGEAVVYQAERKQYETIDLKIVETGEHEICFHNEFSTYSEKKVYFQFQMGNKSSSLVVNNKIVVDDSEQQTLMEKATLNIHNALIAVEHFQKNRRMSESVSRDAAEALNSRVKFLSIGQAWIMLLVGFMQVYILRSLFEMPSDSGTMSASNFLTNDLPQ